MRAIPSRTATAVALLFVSACASTNGPGLQAMPKMPGLSSSRPSVPWTPQIDPKGLNKAQYEKDLAECKAFAEANPDADGDAAAKKGAMKTGLGTAALAGVTVVASGGLALLPIVAGGLAVGTGTSAFFGSKAARSAADAKYQSIIENCLRGRGYSVLG
jgi:hypothetical protein